MKIVYHDDLDGRAAAAVTVLGGPDWAGADLLPMDYSRDWQMPPVTTGEPVAVLDCMLEPVGEMESVARIAALTWIDHHTSSLRVEEASASLRQAAGCRCAERAACELAWAHFHPGEPVPRALDMLGRYDRWDAAGSPAWHGEIMPLQMAMESLDTDPRTHLDRWRQVLEGRGVDDLIEAGRHIWRYRRDQNTAAAQHQAREVAFAGLRAIAVNARGDSQLFESAWDPERYDLMVAYIQMADGSWAFSLYSPKSEVDVSALAEAHGGGGHRDAAGFGADRLDDILGT